MAGTKEFHELSKKYAEHLFGEIQCHKCRHYFGEGKCAAFDKIPGDILDGTHDHRQPYPGDRGIRWEAKEEER